MSRLQADLLLLFVAAIWGLAFVYQKEAMSSIGPLTFIAARSVLATLALAPLAWRESRQHATAPSGSFLRLSAFAGLAFFVGAYLQQAGLVTTTVTNTGFLTALYVVLVPIIGWGWTRRPPAAIVWPCGLLSFVGIWLLGGGTLGALSRGDWLVAASALFWSAQVVAAGQAAHYGRPVLFTLLQFVVVGIGGLMGCMATETVTMAGLWAAAVPIAYVGLLSSALTFTLMAIAMRKAPAAEGAIIMSMENLFAALAAAVLLGERLGLINWLGAGLIVAATLAIQLAPYVMKPKQLAET